MTPQEDDQIKDQLCNNEVSDDEEMISFLAECTTVPIDVITTIVNAERSKCLCDPFYEPDLSQYTRLTDEQ